MEEVVCNEKESQLTIGALLDAAKRRIGLILAITLFLTVVGGIVGKFFVKTKYTSSGEAIVMMTVSDDDANKISSTTAYQNSVYLAETVNTSFLKSDLILKKASETLKKDHNIDIKPEKLKSGLTSTVDSNRGIAISVKFSSNYEAADVILGTILDTLVEELNTKREDGSYEWELFGNSVRITSSPSRVTNDSLTKVIKFLVIFFVIGLVVSAIAIVIGVLLDDTYKTKEQFEKDTGIDVLATLENIALAKEKTE